MNLDNKFNSLTIFVFIFDNNIIEIIIVNQFSYDKNFLFLKLTHTKTFKFDSRA